MATGAERLQASQLQNSRELRRTIPGTALFDGDLAACGFALNAMCYSFNDAANRAAFVADEQAYCDKFALTGPSARR